MPIAAECGSCHKRFKANDKLAGKRVKCPQCGGVIEIPKPEPAPDTSGVYGLLDEEQVGSSSSRGAPRVPAAPAPPAAPAAAKSCPSCGTPLAGGAILCVVCGLDLRTGQKLRTRLPAEEEAAGPQVTLGRKDWQKEDAANAKEKKKGRRRRRAREDTPQAILFLRGCAASFGCALIGSFMWYGLAVWLGIELGIIAWVLGGLAGVGMMIGYGVEDVLAGLASAAMALLAIFAAKAMIIAAVLHDPARFMGAPPAMNETAMEAPYQDKGVSAPEDGGMAAGESPSTETADAAAGDESSGGQGAEGMAAAESPDEQATYEAENLPEIDSRVVTGVTAIIVVIGAVISMFWPPLNILFLLLACGTAYGVGSGGGWLDND